ncbi:GNAT family N-acetyltransferase [Shouchella lonarensis]|uniref:Ribosomal-protein-alanine N-acetyltransferase n=1 Tax=Shouchella lonarensis TaxID=1464122 RepID=A0A1G6PDI9_9BACI|nr:GNAT family N-acetyltransferase [Shouchella lonarensis]SDC77385.1 ribosomal-protein-alanine N-acetyltransferase [Shouchella lonarensis]
MNINITPLQESDTEALFQFEQRHRAYFRQFVPDRGEDYYDPATFVEQQQSLLAEQRDGTSYFYLIKTKIDEIAGRINLVDVNKAKRSAELGYRVGETYVGKGVASAALSHLLRDLPAEIDIIQAKTTPDNRGSQKVMERNGFRACGHTTEDGLTFVHYEWRR